jgi:SP family arabinose:H+ symporter-like MFS transporter
MRPNSRLVKVSLTGALGGLIFGFDIAVVSGIIDPVVHAFALGGLGKGLTVAVGPVGTVIGCFAGGVAGQRLGSRNALRYAAGLYVLVALGTALALNWPMLLVLRFLSGLGLGAAAVLGPVYIAELAPAQWRGRLVGAFQIMVVTGLMLGYISDYLVHRAALGANDWRAMVGIAAAPALLFFVLLFRIPRSPRWSASRGEPEEALAVLAEMGAPDPRAELADIEQALAEEHATSHEPVLQWKYRYPLFLAITIGAFNQLAGINAIWYYAQSIFAAAGFSASSGFAQTMVLSATNLAFTFVGMALIDHFGRKSLLVTGAIGTAACLSGITWVYTTGSHRVLLLPFLVLFMAFFAASQGAVIWVYIGEGFPTSVRSKGQGVGSASHWITNTIISLVFPVVAQKFSAATPFAFFAIATLVQLVVVSLWYPETKGRTLEDLQRRLVKVG